jgi:ribulose 1,5-bisphosphate synthetase/thiazole synthase
MSDVDDGTYSYVCEKCGETITVEPDQYIGGGVWHLGRMTSCKCMREKTEALVKEMKEFMEKIRPEETLK